MLQKQAVLASPSDTQKISLEPPQTDTAMQMRLSPSRDGVVDSGTYLAPLTSSE
jgi:hypothetical protein